MKNERQFKLISVAWQRLFTRISRCVSEKTAAIDHPKIISDLVQRTELSGSYLSSLVFANLIALLGLLTNSVAVVIGAMLISPLSWRSSPFLW